MRVWLVGWSIVVVGCGPLVDLEEGATTGVDTDGTSPGTTDRPPPPTTVGSSLTSPGEDTSDRETEGPSMTTSPPVIDDLGGPCALGEIGTQCVVGSDCCSGRCYVAGPLGGICSECEGDADCRFGCNFPDLFQGIPAMCGDGGLGSGCQTPDACQDGLTCATVIDIPGVFSNATCSLCEADAQCPAGLQCAPDYDFSNFGGHLRCVEPGSLPDDAGCLGPEECASGFCVPLDAMGITLGSACSPCAADPDCGPGGMCTWPTVDMTGDELVVVSGFCS